MADLEQQEGTTIHLEDGSTSLTEESGTGGAPPFTTWAVLSMVRYVERGMVVGGGLYRGRYRGRYRRRR